VKAIYALYSDGHGAQRAVDGLRRAGVPDTEITVISSTPMEDFEFSHINGKNRLWYVASLGGLIGLVGSIALTAYTSDNWPMNVGNMATFAWWAYLVVIFETTMLGAILATVGTLIVTAGLLRRRPALYDPAVSDGKILVGLENPNESRIKDLEAALVGSSVGSLKTV
jgi:hypothetical protein